MAELFVKISCFAFAGAAACLIVTIILFFHFKIPMVIGDLSGKNAQKAIRQMQERNSRKEDLSLKLGKKQEERGNLDEKIIHKKKEHEAEVICMETGVRKETMAVLQKKSNETELMVSEETVMLDWVTESPEKETNKGER